MSRIYSFSYLIVLSFLTYSCQSNDTPRVIHLDLPEIARSFNILEILAIQDRLVLRANDRRLYLLDEDHGKLIPLRTNLNPGDLWVREDYHYLSTEDGDFYRPVTIETDSLYAELVCNDTLDCDTKFSPPLLFEDEKYQVYAQCNGEFGGELYFKDLKLDRWSLFESTCAVQLDAFAGVYYIFNALRHMVGSTSIDSLSDINTIMNLPSSGPPWNLKDDDILEALIDSLWGYPKGDSTRKITVYDRIGELIIAGRVDADGIKGLLNKDGALLEGRIENGSFLREKTLFKPAGPVRYLYSERIPSVVLIGSAFLGEKRQQQKQIMAIDMSYGSWMIIGKFRKFFASIEVKRNSKCSVAELNVKNTPVDSANIRTNPKNPRDPR
ncbi:MAG: hypothetical protein AAF433_08080 [Bacteroidota bacterium]